MSSKLLLAGVGLWGFSLTLHGCGGGGGGDPPSPPPEPPSTTCDDACFPVKGDKHSCRSRINFLHDQDGFSYADAIKQVNKECGTQCSCSTGDFPTPAPTPSPTPPPPPSPELKLEWVTGVMGSAGACWGPVAQGSDVVKILDNNGIRLSTDASPANGCVFRTAQPTITLEDYPHIEVDVETTGNRAAYGEKSGQWFALFLYPPPYAYKEGISDSGEIDLVENYDSVRTNFANCHACHNCTDPMNGCHETDWPMASNQVKAHISMYFDKPTETVSVYRCAFGASTCGHDGERAYLELASLQVRKPYIYTMVADVWFAQPGMNFVFSVTNLRVLRSSGSKSTEGVVV